MPLTTSLGEAVSRFDVHQREKTEEQINIHSCECRGLLVITTPITHITCRSGWMGDVEMGDSGNEVVLY